MHNQGSFGKNADASIWSLLKYFQPDVSNRGHGHLVVCYSTRSPAEGNLCDAIVRECLEASRCRRKMDVSSCVSVFEFADASAAEAMLGQKMPNIKMQMAHPYYWFVQSLDSLHKGHPEPYRECEKNLYLTYSMKLTVQVAPLPPHTNLSNPPRLQLRQRSRI